MNVQNPMSGEKLLVMLRGSMNSFTKKEKAIAEYVLYNHKEVASIPIGTLASLLNLSPSLIVHFCKQLGYNGFQDLKLSLAEICEDSLEYPVYGDYSSDSLIMNTFKNAVLVIEDTLKLNSLSTIEEVASLMVNATRVEFFGSGGSARIAENASRKFLRWKHSVSFHRETNQQINSAKSLDIGNLGIGISYSGETKSIIQCLELAKERGATTLAITSSNRSNLAEIAHITLLAAVRGEEKFGENEFSKIGQTILLDAIYHRFVGKLQQKDVYGK